MQGAQPARHVVALLGPQLLSLGQHLALGSGLRDRHRGHRPAAPAGTASWTPAPTCSFSARPAGLRGAADGRRARPDLTDQRELLKPHPPPADVRQEGACCHATRPGRAPLPEPSAPWGLAPRARISPSVSRSKTSHVSSNCRKPGQSPKRSHRMQAPACGGKGTSDTWRPRNRRAGAEWRGAFRVPKRPPGLGPHTLKNHPSKRGRSGHSYESASQGTFKVLQREENDSRPKKKRIGEGARGGRTRGFSYS